MLESPPHPQTLSCVQAGLQQRLAMMPRRVPLVLYFALQPKLQMTKAPKERQRRQDLLVAA